MSNRSLEPHFTCYEYYRHENGNEQFAQLGIDSSKCASHQQCIEISVVNILNIQFIVLNQVVIEVIFVNMVFRMLNQVAIFCINTVVALVPSLVWRWASTKLFSIKTPSINGARQQMKMEMPTSVAVFLSTKCHSISTGLCSFHLFRFVFLSI